MNTKKITLAAMLLFVTAFTACKKDNDEVAVKEGIERAELIFTESNGYAHGDHFHDLADLTGATQTVIKFDENGVATSGGHLHLAPDAIYKIQLKAWDYTGKEVQNDVIANKATADNYKAFIVGGNFVLNPTTGTAENGAIFQPRETAYGDGTTVSGTGGIATTGILSYFTVGHANEGEKDVTFVLRKVNAGVKATITRNDWNRTDYATAFAGQDVLKLKFEIHAEEEGHAH